MNFTLAECAKEAARRGHEALAVVRDSSDYANCGMYERRNISTVSIDSFDPCFLDDTDIVITSPVKPYYYKRLFDEIHKRGLFTASFASLYSSVLMREYPDLVFTLGDAKIEEFDRYALKYSCISIGNPQYDTLSDCRRKRNDDPESIKRVLIADQGGYPYGKEGKEELAKTLKAIARNDPERIYEIKQRYNGQKTSSQTHAISESLSDLMTDLPENLRLLETDKELEELLADHDAMITTWSTAFTAAAVMNIPVVLISGLPSEDRFDVRRQRIEEAYEDLEKTGCVHDYLSLRQGRISFSYIDEAYTKKLLYDEGSKSAPRVLDLLEMLYEKAIRRGLRINTVLQTGADEFMSSFSTADMVSKDDPAYIRRKDFLIRFNDKMQEWVYINRCMGGVLDLGALRRFYEIKEADDPKGLLKKAGKEFQRAKDSFFESEEGKAAAGEDRILQDFYFDWLYEKGMYPGSKGPEFEVKAPESRYFDLALYELDQRHFKKGLKYLGEFLNIVYAGKSSDLLKAKRLAQNMLCAFKKAGAVRFAVFAVKGRHFKMTEYFDRAFVTGHAITGAALMRVFFKEGRFDECIEVYEECSKKKKYPGGRKHSALKNMADAAAGFFAKRIYIKSVKAAAGNRPERTNDDIIGFHDKAGQQNLGCT